MFNFRKSWMYPTLNVAAILSKINMWFFVIIFLGFWATFTYGAQPLDAGTSMKARIQYLDENDKVVFQVTVPRGWFIDWHPDQFNTQTFSWEFNPTGKAGPYWPLHHIFCTDYIPEAEFCQGYPKFGWH